MLNPNKKAQKTNKYNNIINLASNINSSSSPKIRVVRSPKAIKNMDQSVKTLAIKCYDDQLDCSWEDIVKNLKSLDSKIYEVIAILHDKDVKYLDLHHSEKVKPHYHIIIRTINRASFSVKKILETLKISFKPGEDDKLIYAHGLETTGDFASYSKYLTHETEQSEAKGKHIYDVGELVTNLTPERLEDIRNGRGRGNCKSSKITIEEIEKLEEEAYQLGKDLKSFKMWRRKLPTTLKLKKNHISLLEQSYEDGFMDRFNDDNDDNDDNDKNFVLRVCIFIQGETNIGKTYATKKALKGNKVLDASGGGTGKFDRLTVDNNAIILDDDTCKNLINATDNKICCLYKRNRGFAPWVGQWFVVTSNYDFDKWLGKSDVEPENYSAVKSRFFICEVKEYNGEKRLYLNSRSNRGQPNIQEERMKMFREFRKKFDSTIKDYRPDEVDEHLFDKDMGFGLEADKEEEEELIKESSDNSKDLNSLIENNDLLKKYKNIIGEIDLNESLNNSEELDWLMENDLLEEYDNLIKEIDSNESLYKALRENGLLK